LFAGSEARPGADAGRDERDAHGQDPPGECAAGPRQVQDPAGDPQGQHQAPRRPVREHVIWCFDHKKQTRCIFPTEMPYPID